ncbi:MAG: outer membrane beta-barrel protein [Saprospiraceae bacterium]
MISQSKSFLLLSIFLLISGILEAQNNAGSKYFRAIHIDSGWTAIYLPKGINRMSMIKPSTGLLIKNGTDGKIFVKPEDLKRRIFYLELLTKPYSRNLLVIRNFNLSQEIKVKDSTKYDSLLYFEKYTEGKLNISMSSIPDELNVFVNDRLMHFKRGVKSILISVPDKIEEQEVYTVRVFATRSNTFIRELNVTMQLDKVIDVNYVENGVNWNFPHEIPKSELLVDSLGINNNDNKLLSENDMALLPSWMSFYCDVYYATYSDSLGKDEFQKFTGVSPRNNSIGLNIALLSFKLEKEKVRSNLSLLVGEYAKSSWSSSFNNIMEANVGFKISKSLWIDGGLFMTPIGTEALLPKDNICSSTSIGTFYEPAYLSGIRLNYVPSDKWNFNLYLVNSFNGFEDLNNKKSISITASRVVNDKINIGYSNYLGDDTISDSLSHFRIYQNAFVNCQLNKLKIQLGLDYASQQNSNLNSVNAAASVFSCLATVKYQLKEKCSVYGRLEYFKDENAILSPKITTKVGQFSGYKIFGLTTGIEVNPIKNSYIRLEAKYLKMDKDQEIFYWNGENKDSRNELLIHMGVIF